MPTSDGDNDEPDEISPNCPAGCRKDANWRRQTLDETSLQFFDTCDHCYPGDEIPEVGDEVLRHRSQYSNGNVHRLPEEYDRARGSDDTNGDENAAD